MPFLTQEMIDSLKEPDGSYSRYSLYLLGAVGPGPDAPPPAADWQARVLMNKITPRQVMAINAAARALKKCRGNSEGTVPRRTSSTSGGQNGRVPMKFFRRLRRKLITAHTRELKIVDEIIEEAQKALKGKAA